MHLTNFLFADGTKNLVDESEYKYNGTIKRKRPFPFTFKMLFCDKIVLEPTAILPKSNVITTFSYFYFFSFC